MRRIAAAVALAGASVAAATLAAWATDTASARTLTLVALPACTVAASACGANVVALLLRERTRMHARVSSVEATAAALFTAVPDGMLVLRDCEILAVNDRLCELLGYARDALVGAKRPFPFAAPEHRHEVDEWLDRLMADGRGEAELVLRDAAGARVQVELAGRTIGVPGTDAHGHLVAVRDVSASRRHGERLAELATRDPLTELLNGRGFQERLLEEVRRARLARKPLSIALLHLDGVEDENALATAARRLHRQIRIGEHLGRTRTQELAWILPDTHALEAVRAVERLQAELLRAASDGTAATTLTAGICDLAQADDAVGLYALADRALDRARLQSPGAIAHFSWSSVTATIRDEPAPAAQRLAQASVS